MRQYSGLCFVLILLGALPRSLPGQELRDSPQQSNRETAQPAPGGGLQLRNVSAYFDYYSSTLPGGYQSSVNLLSDIAGGGSAELGWSKSTERSNSSFSYTSSITARVRYSEWNAWNHRFSFTHSYKIAPRLSWGFSTGADLSSLQQSLFTPIAISNVASVHTSFDDLAGALLGSRFNNPQLASVLATAPLVDSPVRTLLYGQRMLTASAQTALSYSYSPRLSITFQGGAARSQHVSEDQAAGSGAAFLIPDTTSGSAGIGLSYSLSPRSQIGGSVISSRTTSVQQDIYVTTSLATFGWTLSRRWIMQVHGGFGFTNPVRQTYAISTRPLPAGGGGLTYKTFEHAFIATVDHSVSDSYGLGASSTSTAEFTWRWARPARPWWVESSFGWQQLQGANGGSNGGNTSGWRTLIGFGRTLTPHVTLFTQYAYVNYSGVLTAGSYGVDQSAVRVSLAWSPRPEFQR